ncbi:Smr/MutS family protein, partial [Escherichia coli]|uniref:Smr/MutS family protein n=1 Tax=Escherichia coli TaxID=562 RepID=UPI002023A98F
PMTSLKTSIKTITYLSDTGCLEIQGASLHILKQQTPLWLAQHPHVMAFHQAPKEYGGDAALLVLIEVDEWLPPELP